MGCWKSKVLPKIKKIFDKSTTMKMKTAAAEACSDFDDSRELINLEFEERRIELKPKVIEIYEASSIKTKAVVRERKMAGIKKNSKAVHKLLQELVKIEFPGSKQAFEYSSKFGPAMVSDPVNFVLEKIFIIVTEEEKKAGATVEAVIKEEKEKEKENENENEAGVEIVEEPPKTEIEKQEVVEETEPEKSEIVVVPMEPSMIGGAAAPKA